MTTPAWQAPLNGLPGNQRASQASAHLNQLLGAHAVTQIGYGNPVVNPSAGWQAYFTHVGGSGTPTLAQMDFAQAFTMSGTTIGRITIPVLILGKGADLLVTLCPDSSGAPNMGSPIAQVKVPSAEITTLAAQTGLENATSPLQGAAFNTQFGTNYSQVVNWISPAATVNGAPSYFTPVTSGNYTLLIGGKDQTSGTSVPLVFTVQYEGGGNVAAPVPQPSLPQATQGGQACATSDTVVYMGGFTSGASAVTNVWSAGWNPNTGVIGAWSAQTALPQAVAVGAAASWGEHIYVIGGQSTTTGSTTVANVWMNTVSNSQLGSWTAMPPLPAARNAMFTGVIGNWLVVAGGNDATTTPQTTCWYAAILPDGTIGPWRTGPSLPQAANSLTAQWCTGVTASSLIAYSGFTTGGAAASLVQVLSVGSSGPAPSWSAVTASAPGQRAMSAFTDGNGIWYLMGYNVNNTAQQNLFQAVPLVSAPLYATGLTSGAQYWVVLQAVQSNSAADYLGVGMNYQAYSVDSKQSLRHQNAWSTYAGGFSCPVTVYDTTLSQPIVHTVEDLTAGVQSAFYERWSTLTYNNLGLLSGAVEVTMQPNTPLNSNPTFTSGVSPWTATNGTITQSSAQTHGGYPFSGLLTPTGGFSQAYATSELVPVGQTPYGAAQWYLATGWLYSPTGWSNVGLSVNWFDSSRTYISTSSTAGAALAANTWTQVSNYFAPPATAAYGQITPTEGGSPGATNLLYMSAVQLLLAPETVPAMASIAQVNYGSTPWPPTGVSQLN